MSDQIVALNGTGLNQTFSEPAISQLRQEYGEVQRLFQAQSPQIQHYLEMQAAGMAEAIAQDLTQVRFSLPDSIQPARGMQALSVPTELRHQAVSKVGSLLGRKDVRTALRKTLLELEQSSVPAVAASAAVLRYAVAVTLVHKMLPAGHTVTYTTGEGDIIPSIPMPMAPGPKSALRAERDAIVEAEQAEDGRSELQVPYVEAARRFYLPQWIAFDEQYQLLVGSLNEAKAQIASMQRYLFLLHAAVGLAPYMVADEEYQQKRYGVLGQLVNQGRALARYQAREIVQTIQRRAAADDLNRGLSLSLPYFDEQKLTIEDYVFDIIPGGRILFIPAFVVRAAHEQQVKVAQDTRLSPATRRHLLTLFYHLGAAFLPESGERALTHKG